MSTSCSAEANPVVYNGTMYIVTGASDVFALDATTGAHLWKYHPTFDPGFKRVGAANHGVAIGGGLVYVPQMDGKMVALNQQTGGVVWTTTVCSWQVDAACRLVAAPVYRSSSCSRPPVGLRKEISRCVDDVLCFPSPVSACVPRSVSEDPSCSPRVLPRRPATRLRSR